MGIFEASSAVSASGKPRLTRWRPGLFPTGGCWATKEAVRGMSPGALQGASFSGEGQLECCCRLSPANHWNRSKLEEAPADRDG